MAARKVASAEAWAKAEQQYADQNIEVSEIAKLVGLAPIQLALAAKARGWPLRTVPKAVQRTSRAKAAATQPPASKSPKPTVLLQHVYKTIEGELHKLDEHTGKSSQDRERASRALSQMVNSLEKAIDMQRDMAKRTKRASSAKDKQELAHAEDLRRTIADRLARLSGKRDSGKRSQKSD